MIDNEQITALAREYSKETFVYEYLQDNPKSTAVKKILDITVRDAEAVLRWLSQRYCLVEKSRLQEYYRAHIEMGHYYNRQAKSCHNNQMRDAAEKCAAVMQGKAGVLKSLFPEIAKEVEE